MVLTVPYSTPTYYIGHILDPRYDDMAPGLAALPGDRSGRATSTTAALGALRCRRLLVSRTRASRRNRRSSSRAGPEVGSEGASTEGRGERRERGGTLAGGDWLDEDHRGRGRQGTSTSEDEDGRAWDGHGRLHD